MMPHKFLSLDWHPQGKLIAASGTSGTYLYSNTLENITPKDAFGTASSSLRSGFGSDGSFLAGDSGDTGVQIWDAKTFKLIGRLDDADRLLFFLWSPDGTQIAGYSENRVSIWSTSTFGLRRFLYGHIDFVHAASWSPDSKLLASSGLDGMIYVWNVSTGQKILSIVSPAGPGTVLLVKWSPVDQQYIATGTTDGIVRIWDIHTGSLYRSLDSGSSVFWISSLAWSHDGKRIALTSDRLQIWDVASERRLFQLDGHENLVEAVAWSPDDRTLVSAGSDGTIRIWDTSKGKLLNTQQAPGGPVRVCAY